MEKYASEYKGIKGWFPESLIKLMEEFDYIQGKKFNFRVLYGKEPSQKIIEKFKTEYKIKINNMEIEMKFEPTKNVLEINGEIFNMEELTSEKGADIKQVSNYSNVRLEGRKLIFTTHEK